MWRGLITVLLLITPAWCVPAQVAQQTCTGGSNCTTAAINTTGANFIIVGVATFGGTVAAPTDSKSNSWTALTDSPQGGILHARLFYTVPTSVGSGHTFTVTTAGLFPALVVMAFSGVKQSSPFDVQNVGNASTSTLQPGSVTPSVDNSLLVTIIGSDTSATPTINSGFSTPFGILGAGSTETVFMSYLVQTPAAAINPTWTNGVGSGKAAAIATFKPLAATGNCAACDMSGELQPPEQWGDVSYAEQPISGAN